MLAVRSFECLTDTTGHDTTLRVTMMMMMMMLIIITIVVNTKNNCFNDNDDDNDHNNTDHNIGNSSTVYGTSEDSIFQYVESVPV